MGISLLLLFFLNLTLVGGEALQVNGLRASYTVGNDIDYTFSGDGINDQSLYFNRTSNLRFVENVQYGNYTCNNPIDSYSDILDLITTDSSNGPESYVDFASDVGGHTGVMELVDGNTGNIDFRIETNGVNCAMDFWIYTEDSTIGWINIRVWQGASYLWNLRLENEKLYTYDGGYIDSEFHLGDGEWHIIHIDADDSSSTYDVWVNGILAVDDEDYVASYGTGAELIQIRTEGSPSGYSWYLDALDLTDEDGYSPMRNIKRNRETTEVYEPDKWAFHMEGENDLLDTTANMVDGTLGWTVDESGGAVGIYTGIFVNPETGEIDSNNRRISLDTSVVATQTFIEYDLETNHYGVVDFDIDLMYHELETVCYTGIVFMDSDDDSLFSFVMQNNGGTIDLNVGDGGMAGEYLYIETKANFDIDDLIELNCSFDTEGNVVDIGYYDEGHNQFYHNMTVRDGFSKIKIYSFATTTGSHTFRLDNVGLYLNGTSLTEEIGYGEYDNLGMEGTGYFSCPFTGLMTVATKYPSGINYRVEDTLDYIVGMGNLFECTGAFVPFNNQKDCLIFQINSSFLLAENYLVHQGEVFMVEGTNQYPGVIEYEGGGGGALANGYFYVEDGTLLCYMDASSGGGMDWMVVHFNLEDVPTTNYTAVIENAFKTNWLYGLGVRLNFTDGTSIIFEMNEGSPYDVFGIYYSQDFAVELTPLKELSYMSLNISITEDTGYTTVIGGIEEFSLLWRHSGAIDLDDLHDSGVLDAIVPIILILAPTFVLYIGIEQRREGYGKKALLPIMALIVIILFISGVLPAWLFFITLICIGSIMLFKRRLSKQ